jgi:hypothetical protein
MTNASLLHSGRALFVDAAALLGKAERGRGIRLFAPPDRRALCKG